MGADREKATHDGQAPLWVASLEGNVEIVKVLCNYGADMNHAADDGTIPLHVASICGNIDVMHFLISRQGTTGALTVMRRGAWMHGFFDGFLAKLSDTESLMSILQNAIPKALHFLSFLNLGFHSRFSCRLVPPARGQTVHGSA